MPSRAFHPRICASGERAEAAPVPVGGLSMLPSSSFSSILSLKLPIPCINRPPPERRTRTRKSKMNRQSPSVFILVIFAIVIGIMSLALPVSAITVSGTTSDNGYPAHLVTWTDASGLPRSAMMVDERSSAPYTGYLRQFRYQIGGTTRICTGSYNYATDGLLEFSGDGFVQNHTAGGADVSTGNGNGSFPGTTAITLQGASHVIITYNIPTYKISGVTVPTTIQWFFADGRSYPIFAITQDASASPGNLGADSRSPYGDMAYDGATTGDPITGKVVGGYSYGDQNKFATLATGPEQVKRSSPWKATEPNTIPYAMQWVDPASGVDAEMGHVATLPLSLSDQGIDTQTSIYNTPPDFFDPRTKSYPSGPLPPDNTQAFQIINETATLPASATTNSKRLAWGAQWGRVGGFDEYGSFTDTKNYSKHSNDPVGQTLAGSRVSGALMAYSVFVVMGPHLGSYKTGSVGQQVTEMENVQLATLTASTGTVAASGPAGVGNASSTTISYSPQGYNPTYACWELRAANNQLKATLSPAQTTSLNHPVFLVNNYTAGQLPASLSVGTGLTTAGTDYFTTLDTANKCLWITVNRVATSAVNVTFPLSADATLSNLVLSPGTLSPPFASNTTSYTAALSNSTASIRVTPTAAQANATITVNGTSVTSGSSSGSIALNVGANTITTIVTAQDGVTTQAYTVTVTRLTPVGTWEQTWYGASANGSDSADPSNTGIPNLAVYAYFGPTQNPALAHVSQLPQLQKSGGNVFFSFTQPSGVSGITYGAQWSTTLQTGSWSSIADTGNTSANPPQHLFSVPIATNSKLFLRLTVSDP